MDPLDQNVDYQGKQLESRLEDEGGDKENQHPNEQERHQLAFDSSPRPQKRTIRLPEVTQEIRNMAQFYATNDLTLTPDMI